MWGPRLGFVTIGQSPRDDVVPELLKLSGIDVEVIEAGALDDMTYEEVVGKLSPETGDTVYVSRMRDGRQVKLSKRKLIPLIQRRISQLNEAGVNLIVLLCSGEFPRFRSRAPILYLDRVLRAFAEPVSGEARRAAIFVPAEEQVGYARERWSQLFESVDVVPVSPYESSVEDFVRAARRAAERSPEVAIMDCIGYTAAHKEVVRSIVGAPVIATRTALANYLRELLHSAAEPPSR
ncbi:MAG: AroM family protein [Thermoproteota archaeon]